MKDWMLQRRQTSPQPPSVGKRYLFLSPEWVHEVAAAVQAAQKEDRYFRDLASAFTMRFACRIQGVPPELREMYGAVDVVVVVHLRKGSVQALDVRGEVPEENLDLVVTSDYRIAKRIASGKASTAASFLSGKVRVQPRKGRQRPLELAKSLVTATEVVKIARQVPTA
jgi:putative sterol carrier protein